MNNGILFAAFVASALCFLSAPRSGAGQEEGAVAAGKAIFEAMKCIECHDSDKQINGPPLKTIATVYGDKQVLLGFVAGDAPAIVEPARAKTMEPRRRKLKKLNPKEQDAVASFIMSFK